MSRNTIPLGRILGIPVGVDPSWFLIFALLTWSLAVSYFPLEFKGWPVAQYWIVGAVTAIMLFVSVVLHELGHSIVALRYKIPVRSITLFVFGGVAQITAEPPSALAEFWIAIAGPATSFLLAGFFRLVEPLSGSMAPLLALARYLAYINGTLALFNLIPGFPLDGGRVFRAIVWGISRNLSRATRIAANVGRAIAFAMILLGVWQALTGNLAGGIWIAFIGWFLESAAVGQLQQQTVSSLLVGHRVSDAMTRSCASVPVETSLQQIVDHHVLALGQRCLAVTRGEDIVGLLTLHSLRQVPRDKWPMTTAGQAMTPMDTMKWVQPDTGLQQALQNMDRNGVNQLPVISDGKVLGILSRGDVISYIRTLQELER